MFDFSQPYPSRRSPIFAANVLASSQPLATQAGIRALQLGGNAVDAALSAAITLTVVEPNNNGLGSDAFAAVWDGRELSGINGSGRAPAAWSAQLFAGRKRMPTFGIDSVTVPGAVSVWVALSERFGRLPFEALFEDALGYARYGYPVGPETARYWQLAADTYADFPEFRSTFLNQGNSGSAPGPGDWVELPDHARSIELIAATRGEAFYRGEIANAMVEYARSQGGCLCHEDLSRHSADWVTPLHRTSRHADATLHEIPPNGQGLTALIALGILDHLDMQAQPLDSVGFFHLQIEAFRLAWSLTASHLADPDAMLIQPESLLKDGYLARLAAGIDPKQAGTGAAGLPMGQDTVYLAAADAGGMMVSFIQSSYLGFGSGMVVPGYGVSLQNRGSGFSLEPGHPNLVAGGKRPFHTIIPGFVSRRGSPLAAFGVMGGHMQAQGHLQMMVRCFMYGQNPQSASDAPRWHLMQDGCLALEPGFDEQARQGLETLGHQVRTDAAAHLFGGAQLIVRMEKGYCAASDHRKEGQAAGF